MPELRERISRHREIPVRPAGLIAKAVSIIDARDRRFVRVRIRVEVEVFQARPDHPARPGLGSGPPEIDRAGRDRRLAVKRRELMQGGGGPAKVVAGETERDLTQRQRQHDEGRKDAKQCRGRANLDR